MKFLYAAILPFVASVFASPVVQNAPVLAVKPRQLESQSAVISSLSQEVFVHTAAINSTLTSVPASPNALDISAAVAEIAPQLTAITNALTAATTAVSKRAFKAVTTRQDACDAECIAEQIVAIVYEITSTIKAIIDELGLDPVLVYINPLLLALSALVVSLDVLVTGLLVTVTAVVNIVLLGLGLSLAALGFA